VTTCSNCRLCAISGGRHATEYDTPVLSGAEYYGLASIGGFVPGWSLLIPRLHLHNLAPKYSEPTLDRDLATLVDAVSRTYGEPAIFEHGSTYDGSLTACGTSHAHLHVVPFSGALVDLALHWGTSLPWEPVTLEDLVTAADGHEYLFVANRYGGPTTVGRIARLVKPQSQFFRRLLAHYLGVPDLADYRAAPLEQLSSASAITVRTAVANSLDRAA
jgi:hypothetical protein